MEAKPRICLSTVPGLSMAGKDQQHVHLFCSSYSVCPNRQVSIEEGDAKAREFSVMFIETSAKAGFNIKVALSCKYGSSCYHGSYAFALELYCLGNLSAEQM